MSPSELDLRESLQHDAARIDTTGDFAAAAITLERRRARRRTTVGAVAATAVLAVATPMVWSTLGSMVAPAPAGRSASSAASTTPVPTTPLPTTPLPTTPMPTASLRATSSAPAPTYNSNSGTSPRVTVSSAASQGTPRTAYAAEGVFHDGARTVPLPASTDISFVARLEGGGVVVNAPAAGRSKPLSFVSPTGEVLASFPDVQGVTVNEAGTRVATADAKGILRLRDARGTLLKSLATKDRTMLVSGLLGSSVYFEHVDGKGTMSTHVWDTTTGVVGEWSIKGRIVDINEATSLAIVMPIQQYDPSHTCYQLYDLVAGAARYTSCGEFAPSHITADGAMVVGPAVGDGAGSSNWLVASTKDASVLLRVDAAGHAWAPAWRAIDDGIEVALLGPGSSSQTQLIASCTVSSQACTVDASARVTAAQGESMMWPITLSEN